MSEQKRKSTKEWLLLELFGELSEISNQIIAIEEVLIKNRPTEQLDYSINFSTLVEEDHIVNIDRSEIKKVLGNQLMILRGKFQGLTKEIGDADWLPTTDKEINNILKESQR